MIRSMAAAGADTLDGGAGNDTYFIDNMDDRVLEALGGGYDIVWTSTNFAMAAGCRDRGA